MATIAHKLAGCTCLYKNSPTYSLNANNDLKCHVTVCPTHTAFTMSPRSPNIPTVFVLPLPPCKISQPHSQKLSISGNNSCRFTLHQRVDSAIAQESIAQHDLDNGDKTRKLNNGGAAARKWCRVYDASWYQPLILPSRIIVHPALKTRACNANHVLILSCYNVPHHQAGQPTEWIGFCQDHLLPHERNMAQQQDAQLSRIHAKWRQGSLHFDVSAGVLA